MTAERSLTSCGKEIDGSDVSMMGGRHQNVVDKLWEGN
jgi:hypothetical protein